MNLPRITVAPSASQEIKVLANQMNKIILALNKDAPQKPYSVDTLADLPPAADYPDTVARVRGSGWYESNGTAWTLL